MEERVRQFYQESKEAIDYYKEHYPPTEENNSNDKTVETSQTSETDVLQATTSELDSKLAHRVDELQQQLTEKTLLYNEQQKIIDQQANRIKELETLVDELKQKKENVENEEWVIELFSHFCYEDVEVAKVIIEEMSGKSDPEIADIIYERRQNNQISSKTNNIDMWRVLHAAKIIESNSFQNLDTALRRRKNRKQ